MKAVESPPRKRPLSMQLDLRAFRPLTGEERKAAQSACAQAPRERSLWRSLLRDPMAVLSLAVLFVLTMGLCVLAAQVNPYLAPTAMVALLATVLLSPSTAFIVNTIAVLLVGVLTNTANTTFAQQMLNMMTAGLLSAPVGIFVLSRRRQQRAAVLLAGGAMAVTDLLAMLAIGCLTNNEINSILTNALWSAGGTVLAALLCMAVQPVLEWCFNLVTPYKLLELANPNQPLLRRLPLHTLDHNHDGIYAALREAGLVE